MIHDTRYKIINDTKTVQICYAYSRKPRSSWGYPGNLPNSGIKSMSPAALAL